MSETTVDRKDHPVDELSALFDEIDVGSNLDVEKSSDYGTASTNKLRPFDDRVEDLHAVMEHEPAPEPETKQEAPEHELEHEFEPDALDQIHQAPKEESEPESLPECVSRASASASSTAVTTLEPKPSPEPQLSKIEEAVEKGDYVKAQDIRDEANSLGLTDIDLRAYNAILKKYPQFKLDDGTHVFKEFYRYKIRALKSTLTHFPVLPLVDMRNEVENIKANHQPRADLSDPVSLGAKMGECSVARGRIAELLFKALAQAPLWKTTVALLNGKVWKDYDIKGAHKREGLIMEHNADVEFYDAELRGFISAASHIDDFFQAQFDSYSRQLTRIDVQNKVGVVHSAVASEIEENRIESVSSVQTTDSDLDGLDTIESGTVLSKVRKGGLVQRDFPGSEIDEFLDGIG